MIATAHALVGATLASKIPDPFLSIPLAFLSHFFLDLVPHWDVITDLANNNSKKHLKILPQTALDVLLGFFLVFFFFRGNTNLYYLLAVVLAAQAPDWIEAPYYFFNINFPLSSWMKKIQTKLHYKLSLPWGLLTQAVVLFIFLLVLGILPF